MIINRYPADKSSTAKTLIESLRSESRLFRRRQLELLGVIPESPELTYCRMIDVQRHLNAEILNAGEMESRRVKFTHLLARTVPNLLHTFAPGALLFTPGDRSDIIVAVGMVSGAVHSTANTIRPALQVIKIKPNAKSVSSVFFMCLPQQVLVYGDCAVVPDPDAETLADIALQSADSAAAFGIPPRVAMISYSTGDSGSGTDVDKVRHATRLAKENRPDLPIDGPLQYDAAFMPDVAKTKAPNSPVAGRATVFIFPDLNTGNTTYKAVQRSAKVISIGPMLQGLKRPVNDLSRGALLVSPLF